VLVIRPTTDEKSTKPAWLPISRVEGFEGVTSHYSPSAWGEVTRRVKDVATRLSVLSAAR